MEVYALIDPRTQNVRYIGVSIDAHARYKQHVRNTPNSSTRAKIAWIDELKATGLKPILAILETDVDQSHMYEREQYWIEMFSKLGQPLVHDMTRPMPGKGGAQAGNQYARKGRTGRHVSVWLSGADIVRLGRILEQMGITVTESEVDSLARSVIRDALDEMHINATNLSGHSPTATSESA